MIKINGVNNLVNNSHVLSTLNVRSAGFEPAIPSLGSSYLNQAGPTSPKNKNIDQILCYTFIQKLELDSTI